ncbi:MAG: hypothetical protein SPJ62_11725 [Inconstantimicrobium porci]|uniref:hypothetical protein n=1 Tax=Inconstantimicrobium porci TaxID=2652291 RepID=UPI002A91F7C7|nr:hypothetical protein [Inconstantimicrobium porci]MDY5912645.1 hypothetical protein [Inconstantimicrobium porci]
MRKRLVIAEYIAIFIWAVACIPIFQKIDISSNWIVNLICAIILCYSICVLIEILFNYLVKKFKE